MANQGSTFVQNLEKHINTIFLGIITAATLGAFTFLWNVNATLSTMQERDNARTKMIDQMQNGLNEVRLDVKDTKASLQDVRERVIRVEAKDK